MSWPNKTIIIPGNGLLRGLCRLFGHTWRPFDLDWCGQDQFSCWRCGSYKLQPTRSEQVQA